ncbi:hypothetical protein [Novosphingobium sp. 9]|uniref:hypothetical protein n=1 Tax=Novosphingobium sp. 9 TaxID=2025349 RepID=UPI0021B5B11F|nr:hypothetical protein [Novosphingobium sp. 9]
MSEDLVERIAIGLNRSILPDVRAFAGRLAGQTATEGPAAGVLFYGSNLRTGSLEGVLDFYVLTDGPVESGIWPRVSYHEWNIGAQTLRAKVATMTLATFREAAGGNLLDTTIWARFVQPSGLAWARSERDGAEIAQAVAGAARTAGRLAVALGPEVGTPEDYWRALFRATYAAEFRVEKPGREDSILSVNREHFDGLLRVALLDAGIGVADAGEDGHHDALMRPLMGTPERVATLRWWRKRRRIGKGYNAVRLVRASTTFEGAARYAAWKIERHTGVPIHITPWREKHPVLAAPGVLWQVWRARHRG